MSSVWKDFIRLVHVYAALFVAPFIFIAALTALLYILTPQFEQWWYADQLTVKASTQKAQPLSQQIMAAQRDIPVDAHIVAIRPAASPTDTTRVMFVATGNDQTDAIFINPYNLTNQGQLTVYGTSGILPLRTMLDHLHRDLLLGSMGRYYSELAASWLGILALSGFYQWMKRRRAHTQQHRQHLIGLHSSLGVCVLPLLLFFSVTGLTWSNWAGHNFESLRHALQWQTPSLNTQLNVHAAMPMMSHHEHHPMQIASSVDWSPMDVDQALAIARAQGITASKLQIRPAAAADKAWIVEEINHRWPIQVDSIAIDLQRQQVVDHVHFAEFPLIAKLTRWGIDAHIGVLFGWGNQLFLIAFAVALCSMIVLAYRAWWRSSNIKQSTLNWVRQSRQLWRDASIWQRWVLILVLLLSGICLPVLGVSLIIALLFLSVAPWSSSRS